MWSEHDRCGPHAILFLAGPELRVIHDLGPAGRSKEITEGVIATKKALEVATVLNNTSLEGEVRVNALSADREALAANFTELEGEVSGKRSVAELSRKLAEEKAALEESLNKAELPGRMRQRTLLS